MKKQTLTLFGMTCTGCEAAVVAAALEIAGVSKAVADHKKDQLIIWGQTPVSTAALEAALPEVLLSLDVDPGALLTLSFGSFHDDFHLCI